MNNLIKVILAVLAVLTQPFAVQAYDFQACHDCHKAALDADQSRRYLHSPFQSQQCGTCHAAKIATTSKAAASTKNLATAQQDKRQINWLGESIMVDTNHGFLLPVDKVGDSLIVEMQGGDKGYSRQQITVPPLADIPTVEDIGRPPVISGVHVLKVERGVFLSATIGWETDSLTKALVRYGENDLSQTSDPSSRFGHRHEVVLYNLKVDQTYRFSVVATDLFGRTQSTVPSIFSTTSSFEASPMATADNPVYSGAGAKLTSSFQRLGSDYLLELTLEQPAAVYVGSNKAALASNASSVSASAMPGNDVSHAGLSSEEVTSIEACRSCHQGQDGASHPVNVYPKPGMTIPPEYPTLPDGRITCNTCHGSHSADYENLSRKSGKRELCIGCHRDMI